MYPATWEKRRKRLYSEGFLNTSQFEELVETEDRFFSRVIERRYYVAAPALSGSNALCLALSRSFFVMQALTF